MTETAKKRVSSLAKQYEIPSDVLMRICKEAGVDVKSTSSMMDQSEFNLVKPLIMVEKDRKEREELVKSGKKIPMKAVLKKAPPIVLPVAKKAAIVTPEVLVAPPVQLQPQIVPTVAPVQPSLASAKTEASETPAPTQIEVAPVVRAQVLSEVIPAKIAVESHRDKATSAAIQVENVEAKTEPHAAAIPVAVSQPVSPIETPVKTPLKSELMVSVEKPDAALLARIAKSQAEAQNRFKSRDDRSQGYSGHLHRVPGAPNSNPNPNPSPGFRGPSRDTGSRPPNSRGPGGPSGGSGGQGSNQYRPGGPGGPSGQNSNQYRPSGPGGPNGQGSNQYRPSGPGGPNGQGSNQYRPSGPGGPGGQGSSYRPSGPGGPGGSGPSSGSGSRGGYSPGPSRGAPSRDGGLGARTERPSFEPPRDIYAQRAQAAGVVNSPRGGGDKDKAPAQGHTADRGKPRRGGGHRRKTREQIEAELLEARNSVTKVMASLSRTPNSKARVRGQKEDDSDTRDTGKKIFNVSEFVTIGEIAGLMNVLPAQVIAKCMELGMMVTINQRLDHEIIALVADEFGFEAHLMEEYAQENLGSIEDEDESLNINRAPIITVMGHVDHGKTSILDYIRKTNVIAGEAGGITQHIGAYMVETVHGPICFLDTPGHEAFSAMRERGANVTDVVLLVVAADSMVMPQTKEAIQLAKNANVQIIVAINKVDLPAANPDKIRAQLAESGVEVEQWGGKYPCLEVSAKTGLGMDKLLETLALESEILALTANPDRLATGSVIESRLDKGKGAVATVLIQNGTLRVGDAFVTGIFSGKVRSLLDERGRPRKEAGPSTPVQVLGLEGTPQAGDSFIAVEDEREAREIASRRRTAAKDRELRQKRHITLDQLYDQIKSGEFHELKVIVKADVDGSLEAIASSLEKLSTKEVRVNVISKGVGAVKEADIHLAAASDALVIAFHVIPSEAARDLAEKEGVTINLYRIIYEVIDEVKIAMQGMLQPEYREEVAAEATILKLFHIPKVGLITGCKVQSGMVERDLKARLYRNGIEVGEAKVVSLKREKDDVKTVKAGFECGIGLDGIKDIQEGDVLAFFRKVEIARKLSAPITA